MNLTPGSIERICLKLIHTTSLVNYVSVNTYSVASQHEHNTVR